MTLIGRAYRVTAVWQLAAALAIAMVVSLWLGAAGFLSAILGGVVGMTGVLVQGLVARRKKTRSPVDVVRVAIRAEAAKVGAIVLLLWLAFSTLHEQLIPLAFIGAFIVSVLLSGVAFVVAEEV
jgi:F0F1-type ATP synthase assembly protein I